MSGCGCCNVSVAASCHKGSHLIGRRRGTAARPCFSSRASEVLLASEGSHWLDARATNPRFPASAPQHYWPTGLQPRPTWVPAEMAIESPLSAEPAARSRFRGLGLRCQQLGDSLASDTIKAKEAFSDYRVRLFISRSEAVRKAGPSSCLFSMQSVGLHALYEVHELIPPGCPGAKAQTTEPLKLSPLAHLVLISKRVPTSVGVDDGLAGVHERLRVAGGALSADAAHTHRRPLLAAAYLACNDGRLSRLLEARLLAAFDAAEEAHGSRDTCDAHSEEASAHESANALD